VTFASCRWKPTQKSGKTKTDNTGKKVPMPGDNTHYQHPLRVLTDHALLHQDAMPMRMTLASAPLLTKLFNLIDDDEDKKKTAKKVRIGKGITIDSAQALELSTDLLGGQEAGIEHIALDEDERKPHPAAASISHTAQIKEQDRRHNVMVYDITMANELLDLASATVNKEDSPEHILAHLDTYNNFAESAAATLGIIKTTATDAWQGRTSAVVNALKRLQPKAVGERDLPAPEPRDFRKELDGEFALLQHNLDGMKNCIDVERQTIAHLPDCELTKECWELASLYLDDAKAHAAEWQRSIRLPPERGPSDGTGRSGGAG